MWEEGEDGDSWDKRLAKKYYDKLFKEYCLSDLSRYKENKVCRRLCFIYRTKSDAIIILAVLIISL